MTVKQRQPEFGDPDPPTEVALRIGQNLRRARKMCRLTQRALGERAGVSYKQIQKYEQGRRIRADALWQIAKTLDVPVEFFFQTKAGESQPGSACGHFLHLATLGERERRVVMRIQQLDAALLATLDELLTRLLSNATATDREGPSIHKSVTSLKALG